MKGFGDHVSQALAPSKSQWDKFGEEYTRRAMNNILKAEIMKGKAERARIQRDAGVKFDSDDDEYFS
jgi:hypothetical protein